MQQSNQKKYLILRILGNDLEGLHGTNQTILNLEFTLKNESTFDNCKKMFILNRIVSKEKKQNIIHLLNTYKYEFIDIPFDINEFKKISFNIPSFTEFKAYDRTQKIHSLINHNLYLINNNGARNFCISYGKENGYMWTFVLDSNSFFTKEAFEDIIKNIDEKNEYLIIPQKRLKDNNLSNNLLLTNHYKQPINDLPIQEPQIAFHKNSKYIFNEKIPYGEAPKAELLNALGVEGKWCSWTNFYDFYGLDIKPRKFKNIHFKKLSYIIRLSPFNNNNNFVNNWDLRYNGLYLLIKDIFNSHLHMSIK